MRAGERAYRTLLGLYPRRFREAHEGELLQVFRLQYAAARRRGTVRAALFWLDTLGDVVGNALALRLGARGRTGAQPARLRRSVDMSAVVADLRYTARVMVKQPGFALVVVLTLALGVGANTAIFSVVNGILLAPLPYAEPDALVRIWEHDTNEGRERGNMSPADFHDYQAQNSTLRAVGAYGSRSATLTGHGEPQRIPFQVFTPEVFDILGVEPLLGRTLKPEDEDGPGSVAVLSYGFWQRVLGGDSSALGSSVVLGGNALTVVGIMPRAFRSFSGDPALWVPWRLRGDRRRAVHFLRAVARLQPGATLADARADLTTIARRLEREYPDINTGHLVTVASLEDAIVGEVRPALLLMMGAVGFVFLIACANVANLFFSRSIARRREMAVRAALGAGRVRLVRQLVTENMVLALLGGAVGIALGYVAVEGFRALGLSGLPRAEHVRLSAPVMAFAMGLAALGGVLFGLAPSVYASRQELATSLADGGRGASSGRAMQRLRGSLVVVQMTLAIVLLVGAGLLLRSFERIQRVDPGFNVDDVLVARISLSGNRYPNTESVVAFQEQLREGLRGSEGVLRSGTVTFLPLSGNSSTAWLNILGRPPWPDIPPEVNLINASGDYFRAMGVTVQSGRVFDERDRIGSPPVVVINETAARQFWPGADPVGERIRLGPNPDATPLEIIGVTSDMRQYGLNTDPFPAAFTAASQGPWSAFFLVMQMAGDPRLGIGVLRGQVKALDPDLVVDDIMPMAELVGESVAGPRVGVVLLGAFALIALSIAAVGIYGVVAYSVAQRTQEIGIRMALGAKHTTVLSLVIGRALGLAGIAVVLGLGAAVAASRVLAGMLFQVSAVDPVTFVAVPVLLFGVAVLAALVPARRAAGTDPVRALRME